MGLFGQAWAEAHNGAAKASSAALRLAQWVVVLMPVSKFLSRAVLSAATAAHDGLQNCFGPVNTSCLFIDQTFAMDLRDLRYFEAIAELQHLGQAALRLHRTQPALSSSLRRLEAACGAALFERAGRGIRLTAAGHVLLKWAQRLRFDLDDARREMATLGQGMTGQVRIGIVPTAAQFLLPPVARALLHEAPQVTLRTTVALLGQLEPLLQAGEIDLMVATESSALPGVVAHAVAEDAIVVAAAARHPLFARARQRPGQALKLRELLPYRWALQPPGAPTRDWLDHCFDRQSLPRPQVQVESSMLLMLPALIEQTGLLSFISRLHLSSRPGAGGLKELPVKQAVMKRRLVLSQREGAFVAPAVQRVCDLLVQQVRLPAPAAPTGAAARARAHRTSLSAQS
jgi:DNA-binding transcriptional LysR family regulator